MKFSEGVFGYFWCDKGVTVAVAANPVRKAEFWIGVLFAKVFDIPTGIFPREFEGTVKADYDFGEGFAEIRQSIPKFLLNCGPLDENFPSIPKGLELSAERICDAATIMRIMFRGFKTTEFLVNSFVADAHRGAFCFGWMGS
jgi:hypothetical protein